MVWSLCSLYWCAMPVGVEELLVTAWNCTYHNLDNVCNKLSSTKYISADNFSEKTLCGSILVSNHFL